MTTRCRALTLLLHLASCATPDTLKTFEAAGLTFVLIPGTDTLPAFYLATTEVTNAQWLPRRRCRLGRCEVPQWRDPLTPM